MILQPRDVGHPGPDHRPVDAEDQERREPRAHTATTLHAGRRERARQILVAVRDQVVDLVERGDHPWVRRVQLVARRERDHLVGAGDHRALHLRLLVVRGRDTDLRMEGADTEDARVGADRSEGVDSDRPDRHLLVFQQSAADDDDLSRSDGPPTPPRPAGRS